MIPVFPHDRDTAAAGSDDGVLRVHERLDRGDLDDLLRAGARDDLTPAAACVLGDIDALFGSELLGLFLGHERADGLGRMLERGIGRINGDLRQNGRAVDAEAPAVELFADHVLQIVADVALAHGHAHGKGHDVALGLLLVVSGEGVLDHADLRAVAVGDDDLVAVFDQVRDGAGRRLDSLHLLFKIFAQSVAAQSDHNSFSHFLFLLILQWQERRSCHMLICVGSEADQNILRLLSAASSSISVLTGSLTWARKIMAAMMYGL